MSVRALVWAVSSFTLLSIVSAACAPRSLPSQSSEALAKPGIQLAAPGPSLAQSPAQQQSTGLAKSGSSPAPPTGVGPGAAAAQPAAPNLDKVASLPRQAALTAPAQQRIVIRTVEMTLVVNDVPGAMERVSDLASETGGWIVSSKRTAKHQATIAIRVPAERVDEALRTLRGLAKEVKAENSTGQDATDEYVDIRSRVRNYQKTADQLLKIMERPGTVQDVLQVQRELTQVQGEIERLQGRMRFLEETAAFSLISVTLDLAPGVISVDTGTDQVVAERETVSFRATFRPPEGITDFSYQWDFGDGTQIITGSRTAPTADGKARTTATVTHAYGDVQDSPFIATFTITGTGEAGITKGTDTVVVTVTKVPNIQVDAGQNTTASENRKVHFSGSITRPDGVSNLAYRWDFGDGREPVTGPVPDGKTTVEAEHTYTLQSASPYSVTLTVSGKTGFGAMVEGSDTISVLVTAESPWITRVGDFGATARAAVRTLSVGAQSAVHAGIWLIVFSPVWLIGLVATLVTRRLVNRSKPPRAPGEGHPTPNL